MGQMLRLGRVVLVGLVLGLAVKPVKGLGACAGDCDGHGNVTANEIMTLVNVALGTASATACANGISSGTAVNVALIIQAANAAQNGCAASTATPTATPTPQVVATHTAAIVPPGISTQMLGIWSGRAVNQATSVDNPARIKIEVVGGAVVITDLGGSVFLNGPTLTATLIPIPTSLVVSHAVGSYPSGYVETLQLTLAPNGQLIGPYGKMPMSFPQVPITVLLELNKEP